MTDHHDHQSLSTESQEEIEARVLKKFPQERGENAIEGPHQIGQFRVARVWTYHKSNDEYHAHYHVRDGERTEIFRNFPPFAIWLGEQELFRDDRKHGHHLDLIRASVASILVLGALVLVGYGFWKTPDISRFLNSLITGVLLGAAGYLFASSTRTGAKRS